MQCDERAPATRTSVAAASLRPRHCADGRSNVRVGAAGDHRRHTGDPSCRRPHHTRYCRQHPALRRSPLPAMTRFPLPDKPRLWGTAVSHYQVEGEIRATGRSGSARAARTASRVVRRPDRGNVTSSMPGWPRRRGERLPLFGFVEPCGTGTGTVRRRGSGPLRAPGGQAERDRPRADRHSFPLHAPALVPPVGDLLLVTGRPTEAARHHRAVAEMMPVDERAQIAAAFESYFGREPRAAAAWLAEVSKRFAGATDWLVRALVVDGDVLGARQHAASPFARALVASSTGRRLARNLSLHTKQR